MLCRSLEPLLSLLGVSQFEHISARPVKVGAKNRFMFMGLQVSL
jgi:hypothetical protein